jgi:hypothetical protein
MVSSMNGVQNRFGAGARARGADPEFYRLAAALRRIQTSGAVGMRLERTGDQEWAMLSLSRGKLPEVVVADVGAVREILGLPPDIKDFRVVFGSAPASANEVAMLTRSMLEMLLDLAATTIDVPASHVAEGRVPATPTFATDPSGGYRPMLRVRSGTERPDDAFVAIRYSDHWFWIEDRDHPSKQLFSFLLILFSLTESDTGKMAPLVTIPAG